MAFSISVTPSANPRRVRKITRAPIEWQAREDGCSSENSQDCLTAGCGLEFERWGAASAGPDGISANEIFGSIRQREWMRTIQKNNLMRQQIFQPPSNSPARRAVTADGRLNLLRGSKNTSMNGRV